ncbi:Bifunctional ligase/repressor BirA [subsurface metagenome]
MIDFRILHLQEVDSTNNYLKKYSKDNTVSEGTVILADYQKNGKGKGKNSWYSGADLNVTFSLLLRPELKTGRYFILTEFVSLAITDALKHFGIESLIKWPNDVYVGDFKIAGILIENTIVGSLITRCIVGIGINVNEEIFPAELSNPISMRSLKNKIFQKDEVIHVLLDKIRNRYNQLKKGTIQTLHTEYNKNLFRRGKVSGYKHKDRIFKAELIEIDTTGVLKLKTTNGKSKQYLFGEVEMII